MYISIRNALMHDFELPMGFYENLRFGISSPRAKNDKSLLFVFFFFLLPCHRMSPCFRVKFFNDVSVLIVGARLLTFDFSRNVFRHAVSSFVVTSQSFAVGFILSYNNRRPFEGAVGKMT